MIIKANSTNFLVIFFEELFEFPERGDAFFDGFKSDAVFDNLKHHNKILNKHLLLKFSNQIHQLIAISTNFFSIFLVVLFFSKPFEEVLPFEVGSDDDLEYVTTALKGGFKAEAGCDSLSMPNI